MANWALVIGVDKYWVKEASLRGAVRDALNVRQWLIDSGSVPEANITMLLGPDHNPVQPGISAAVPTQDEIINAATALVAKSGGRGDRFFFHFSGHGISTLRDYALAEAIFCSDATANNPSRSLTVRSILEYFAATQFAEQFFFIDACRNVPWEGQFRVGDMPWQPPRDATRAAVQQFVMFATSPGVKAAEMTEAANEQGAFTESLLNGLGGKASAKAWDRENDEYVVRFDRLFDFVVKEVQEKNKNVGERGRRLLQLPRRGGEQGGMTGSNPVLARFPEDSFPKEKLQVAIDPFVAAAHPILRFRGGVLDKEHAGFDAVPVALELPPDEYKIRCSADGYLETEKKGWYVPLWKPQSLTVTLREDPNYGLEALGLDATRGLEHTNATNDRRTSGTITVYSQDELAPLELYNSSGVLLASGTREIFKENLPEGRYVAVLRMPGVEPVSETIDLEIGEDETVNIKAPRAGLEGVVPLQNVESDGTVLISETSGVGPVAAPQLSTILALAGGASLVDKSRLEAYHLRQVGLKTFLTKMPGEASGTMLIVGDETEGEELARARVRMWRMGEPVGPARELLQVRPHIAEYAEPAPPGSYWIAVEAEGQPPLVFASAVVRKRVHMIVLARGANGVVQAFEYLPLTEGSSEHPQELRRLDMMQRHYAAGSLQRASELVHQKFVDPTMGCLGGYMFLRLNEPERLSVVVQNMTGHFGELCDSFVLKGEYEAAHDRQDQAITAYHAALDRGIPLVLEGVARLRAAVERYGIDHPRREALARIWEQRMRDSIWTVFTGELTWLE